MTRFADLPKPLFRLMKKPPQLAYALGLGPLIGRLVLLLTTTGRKSGLPRVTPLQYEQVDEVYYLGASRGLKSDWVRNIQQDPRVEVRVRSLHFQGTAEVLSDPDRVLEFLQLRLRNHPRMVRAMLNAGGISGPPTHDELLAYARQIALVAVRPRDEKEI